MPSMMNIARPARIATTAIVALGLLATLSGCRGQKSRETPIFGIRNMYDQEKYDVQEESDFFDDKRTMRPPVEFTVSREREIDIRVAEGRTDDGQAWVPTVPRTVVDSYGGMDAALKRGQERYNICCAPCHDQTGAGNGLVKQRAVAAGAAAFVPPTYHQDRIRHMPDGQLYATIANGKGNMPSYPQIAVNDRWAIVLYVRALQLSQAPIAPKESTNPAPGGSAAPATSGSAAPATSGSAAPATSGSAAPATSGSAAPATSGKPANSAAPAHSASAAPR